MYYAYVLRNPKGVLYKGSTDNLKERIKKHNSDDGFRRYTNNRGTWKLVYKEEFKTRKEAELREKFFKSGKGRECLNKKLGDYPPKADG